MHTEWLHFTRSVTGKSSHGGWSLCLREQADVFKMLRNQMSTEENRMTKVLPMSIVNSIKNDYNVSTWEYISHLRRTTVETKRTGIFRSCVWWGWFGISKTYFPGVRVRKSGILEWSGRSETSARYCSTGMPTQGELIEQTVRIRIEHLMPCDS